MFLVYALAAGVLLGLLGRGRLSALGEVRFRLGTVALAGLLFQVLLFSEPVVQRVGSWGPPLYVASTGAVLVALLANLRLPGFPLIALGATLNLVAIVANGGQMPASPEAYAALTGHAAVPSDDFSNSALQGPSTAFPFLGDIFAVPPAIPFANVFSIGDVAIWAGVIVFVARTMQLGRGARDESLEGARRGAAARRSHA